MRIFVTGALGFIGAHFVERALAAGHHVVGLYRSADGDKQDLLQSFRSQGASLVAGDVLNAGPWAHLLDGVDCVCHFAAAFKGSGHSDDDFHRINVTGTEHMLATAASRGVRRFVLCSTAGIYGQSLSGTTDESAPARPWNGYERSKHAAEQLLREQAPTLGMEYVILRPAVVYGPRDDRLLKLFRAAGKGRFPLFGPGKGRRHMVYVTDVADAFLLACTEARAAGQEMIIAGPQAVQLRELLDVLAQVIERRRCGPRLPLLPMLMLAAIVEDSCKLLGVDPPLYRRRMDFYRSDAAFDCRHAHEVMAWTPKVGLRDGLRLTYTASRSSPPVLARAAAWLTAVIACLHDYSTSPGWLL